MGIIISSNSCVLFFFTLTYGYINVKECYTMLSDFCVEVWQLCTTVRTTESMRYVICHLIFSCFLWTVFTVVICMREKMVKSCFLSGPIPLIIHTEKPYLYRRMFYIKEFYTNTQNKISSNMIVFFPAKDWKIPLAKSKSRSAATGVLLQLHEYWCSRKLLNQLVPNPHNVFRSELNLHFLRSWTGLEVLV